MKKPIMAIMYDFDKTLCTTDMQNYSFIPDLGMTPAEFWKATGEFSAKTGVERILSYMYVMVALAEEKGLPLTKKYLNSLGKNIKYFPGVENWFKRINNYGKLYGVKVEHYLVSSGTKEIIEGSSIAKYFKKIYGCEFYYDPKTDLPKWPKLAINYTQKTQYFYRISKGFIDTKDDIKINEKTVGRRVPYQNIVYLGDGMTDVPCMTVVKENGGKSIAIYDKKDKKAVNSLLKGRRVNYSCKANYSPNSELDKIIKLLIENISINFNLNKREEALFKNESED